MYAWAEHGLNGGIDAQFGRARPSQSDPGTQGPRDPGIQRRSQPVPMLILTVQSVHCVLYSTAQHSTAQHSTAQYSTVCPVPFVPRHTF
jgi:hypothetical protein